MSHQNSNLDLPVTNLDTFESLDIIKNALNYVQENTKSNRNSIEETNSLLL